MSKEKPPVLVSACLAGVKCRYDGRDSTNIEVQELAEQNNVLLICPETLAGLPVLRLSTEQKEGKVINSEGDDLTSQFEKGAKEALEMAELQYCRRAILKEKSPMCGVTVIYDGSFTHNLIPGSGIFTKLLRENGIEVEGKYRS